MSVALTATELINLKKRSSAHPYLSYVPDTVVASATISVILLSGSNVLNGPSTLYGFTVSGTSVGWSNIAAGMVVYIGSSAGLKDIAVVRVRKAGNATTLYVAETSLGDPGEFPRDQHGAGIAVGQFVTIIDRSDAFTVIPRILYSGSGTTGSIYEDYDRVQFSENKYPPPIASISINGRANHYNDLNKANASTVVLTVTTVPQKWPTSASTTVLWTIPGSWTVTSGSTTTTSFTATVPAGSYYKLQLATTENNGQVSNRIAHIWIYNSSFAPMPIHEKLSDVRDLTGRTIQFAQHGITNLSSIPEGAFVSMFWDTSWDGSDVATATKQMNGWLIRQSDPIEERLRRAEPTIVGPAGLLAMLGGYSQYFATNNTPLTWQEVASSLNTVHFITWWMLYWRAANILKLFDYNPYMQADTSGSNSQMTDWKIDAGNLLQQIQVMAQAKSCNLGCDSYGSFWFHRDPAMEDPLVRVNIPIRCTLDASIMSQATLEEKGRVEVGTVRGEAFHFDGAKNQPMLSNAPGTGPGQSGNSPTLQGQVCVGQIDLNMLTGNYAAILNNPYPQGSFVINGNWDVFEPAELYRISLSLPAYLRWDNQAFSKYIVLQSITREDPGDGRTVIRGDFKVETVGVPGVTIPVPPPQPLYQDSGAYSNPTPISPILTPPIGGSTNPANPPSSPTKVPLDGNGVVVWNATDVRVSTNALQTSPTFTSVVPSGAPNIKSVQNDPFSTTKGDLWLLGDDATNSFEYYAPNVIPPTTPVWVKGANLGGIWTLLRRLVGANTSAVYSPTTGSLGTSADFTTGQHGWVTVGGGGGGGGGFYDGANGFKADFTGGTPYDTVSIQLGADFAAQTITSMTIYVNNGGTGASELDVSMKIGGIWQPFAAHLIPAPSGVSSHTFTGGGAGITNIGTLLASGTTAGAPVWITRVDYGGPATQVAYTTNNGSVISGNQVPGASITSPGAFDTYMLSNNTVAAAGDNKSHYANTFNGSFTNGAIYTQLIQCQVVPWYTFTGGNNNGALPEYISVLGALSSGGSVFWETNTGTYDLTPTIGGYPGLGVGPNCLTVWKNQRIAAILSFNGVRHLVTTVDQGVTWIDRGTVDASADYIRFKRTTGPGNLFAFSNGNVLTYSTDIGQTLRNVSTGLSALKGVEFWG